MYMYNRNEYNVEIGNFKRGRIRCMCITEYFYSIHIKPEDNTPFNVDDDDDNDECCFRMQDTENLF